MSEETLRVPRLRIELGGDGRSIKLIEPDKPDRPPVPCRLDDKSAGEYREELKRILRRMKERVTEKQSLTMADAAEALSELNRRGLSLISRIFEIPVREIADIFQEVYPFSRSGTEPIVITIAAELGRFIPFEFLPLFKLGEWPPITDSAALEGEARRFPAFSAIVQREFKVKPPSDLILQNEPKLSVRCFFENSLPGALDEIGFFQANNSYFDIEGPWPTTQFKHEQFSEAIADHLRFANQTFDGKSRSSVDQIQHFTCHCMVDNEVSSESELELSNGNVVTIADLEAIFVLRDLADRQRSQSGPLIFLNACGSAGIDPMAVTSFPNFFLKRNGNRGFIGTEINVPDSFAAEFSKCFYRGLLKGLNLGKAIHQAKLTMLREKNNPLGLLYTVYADPDLRVSKPVPVNE